jgi:hypothetical protein
MEASRMKRQTQLISPMVSLLLLIFATGCKSVETSKQRDQIVSNAQAGKALFEEKCKTVAGEKIYRIVQDVEGIVLLKVRPQDGARQWADPLWPGAAFARESTGNEYIATFLGYEYSSSPNGDPVTPKYRGYIATDKRPEGLPGYRYVDVIDEKDGKRYRYTGSEKVIGRKDINALGVQMALQKNPNYDLNVYNWMLDKTLAPDPSPRYGVTFEDQVVSEERALGVASSTIKVIDLQTNEVLGEMIRYAWRPRGLHATEWLTALRCPDHAVGTNAATRKFVDQILLPKKEQ